MISSLVFDVDHGIGTCRVVTCDSLFDPTTSRVIWIEEACFDFFDELFQDQQTSCSPVSAVYQCHLKFQLCCSWFFLGFLCCFLFVCFLWLIGLLLVCFFSSTFCSCAVAPLPSLSALSTLTVAAKNSSQNLQDIVVPRISDRRLVRNISGQIDQVHPPWFQRYSEKGSKKRLDNSLKSGLRDMVLSAPPKPVGRQMCDTWIIFTDGACAPESQEGSIGGLIISPCGVCHSFFSETVPKNVLSEFFRFSKNPIHELEILPALGACLAWGRLFARALVVYYTDNESSRMAL